jgi:hypothetical protein
MPSRQLPTSFTATRQLNLGGTIYAAGAAIPTAVVAGIRRASALLSRRWIVPTPETYPRHSINSNKPAPTTLGAEERRALGG